MVSYKNPESIKLTNKDKKESIKADWNEYLFNHHDSVRKHLNAGLNLYDLTYYPEFDRTRMKESLRDLLQIEDSYILVSNGSDDVIKQLIMELSVEYSSIFGLSPEYSQHFEFASRIGMDVERKDLNLKMNINAEKVLALIDDCNCDIIYLSNPHNPTGLFINQKTIVGFIRNNPEKLFVIDEAYADFDRCSIASSVESLSNVIIVRSFSKAFGLAGLRVGYSIVPKGFNIDLHQYHNKKNVSQIGLIFANLVLENVDYYIKQWERMIKYREELAILLKSLGFFTIHNKGNFISILISNENFLEQFMKQRNIYIRSKYRDHMNDYELFRITIPDATKFDLLKTALKNYSQKYPNSLSIDGG